MEVKKFLDNPDGSATVNIDLSEVEVQFLINYAINDIFLKKLDELYGK